ncbi:MAG: hypothetical protein ABS52_13935 [Gemmatimonadetes bacterium SCN 70-22]|nr:MAG: hypothetical protein ABS52_13935 [Gemmatimonadetes bacterium SCN 70-22]
MWMAGESGGMERRDGAASARSRSAGDCDKMSRVFPTEKGGAMGRHGGGGARARGGRARDGWSRREGAVAGRAVAAPAIVDGGV